MVQAIRECEAHIACTLLFEGFVSLNKAAERTRIREALSFAFRLWLTALVNTEDVRRKKPPLPIQVNDRLAQMKRESSALVQRAEALEDDQHQEKEALLQQANEVLKERQALKWCLTLGPR